MIRTLRPRIVSFVVVFLVATVAFAGGWAAARAVGNTPFDTVVSSLVSFDTRQTTPGNVRQQFGVFWEVWDLVDSEFYHQDTLDHQRMVYGAIRGMLGSLDDRYTTFQEPEAAEQSRESMRGSFEGIGAYLRVEAGQIVVDSVIEKSPAAKAGVQRGDIIVRVDGVELAPLIADLDDGAATKLAAAKIRGPKGTDVMLMLRRPLVTASFDTTITRDEVPLITVNSKLLDDGVAYIQITAFKGTTTQALDEALRELLPQQPTSIVLDLRDNPGGFLRTAQEVLGRFYQGVALYEEQNDGLTKELMTIDAPKDVRVFDLPIVVLVNSNSASAAEIVAGALHDRHPNTTLIGETSYGKGSVQNIHQLRDGSSTRITIARWFTPDHTRINEVGITPEYVVPASDDVAYSVPCVANMRPAAEQTACHDAQLSWGLRFLTEATPPPPVPVPTSNSGVSVGWS